MNNNETKDVMVLRKLRDVQKNYENGRRPMGFIDISAMAKDSADVINDLHQEIKIMQQELTAKNGMVDSLYKQKGELEIDLQSTFDKFEEMRDTYNVKPWPEYKKQDGMHPKDKVNPLTLAQITIEKLGKELADTQAFLFSTQQVLLKETIAHREDINIMGSGPLPDDMVDYPPYILYGKPEIIVIDDPMDKNFAAHCEELRLKKEEEDAIAHDLARQDKNEQDYIEVLKIQALKEAFEQTHEKIDLVKEEIDGIMGETLVPETEELHQQLTEAAGYGHPPTREEAEEHNALLEKMRAELRGDIHE